MRHVVFRIGSERYGLPLATVREVVTPGVMSAVPCAPNAFRGIMNLRGRVVTVVDLGVLLGVAPETAVTATPPGPGKVVILDRGRRDLGLFVTEVDGIHALEEATPAPGEATAAVRGVASHPKGAVTVLDADGVEKQVLGMIPAR